MKMYRFREFDREQSVASLAVGLALASLLMCPLAGALVALPVLVAQETVQAATAWTFGVGTTLTFAIVLSCCIATVTAWPTPQLRTRHFSWFQYTTGAVIWLLRLLPDPFVTEGVVEKSVVINGVQGILGGLLVVANVMFVVLALSAKQRIARETYLGFLFNIASLVAVFK